MSEYMGVHIIDTQEGDKNKEGMVTGTGGNGDFLFIILQGMGFLQDWCKCLCTRVASGPCTTFNFLTLLSYFYSQ